MRHANRFENHPSRFEIPLRLDRTHQTTLPPRSEHRYYLIAAKKASRKGKPMPLSDPEKGSTQYRGPSNLDSRITLHQRFSVGKTPWHRWTFERMNLASNVRVLEAGRGNAASWTENRERIPETAGITFTEAEESMNLYLRNTFIQNFTVTSSDARGACFGEGEVRS